MSYRLIPQLRIARVLVTANFEDAYYRTAYSFSPLPFLIENARLRMGSNSLNEKAWFMKTVLTEEEDGSSETFGDGKGTGTEEIMSCARWLLPVDVKEKLEKEYPRVKLSVSELEELDAERRMGLNANGEPNGLNEQMIEEVGQAMERARTALPTHRPDMYLDLLATIPSHQRRSLATAQVKWGLELADREGIPVFPESTQSGKGLYENLGFKAVMSATHDLQKWGGEGLYTHTFMIREPEVEQG